MQTLAQSLAETWANGNRRDVADTIASQPNAAAGAALALDVLEYMEDLIDALQLRSMLQTRDIDARG